MRVLCEPSVYLSHLLSPSKQGASSAFIEQAVEGSFTLLFSSELLEELVRKLTTGDPRFKCITIDEAEELAWIIEHLAEPIPYTRDIYKVSRDVNDDYLVTYAIVGRADYLVTLDKDLLEIPEIEGLKILRPGEFLNLLQEPCKVQTLAALHKNEKILK